MSSSSSKTGENSINEDATSSSSSSSSSPPQILTRSMVAMLIQDLDASDVLECYALVRKAPLQVGSTLNQTLVVSKMALGLRYLPPSNSKSSKQAPKPKLELTLEYGPQRLDNQRESTPLVQHPDATPSSASSGGGMSSGTSGEESLSVTWENQGRIYYTTSLSTSHYKGAYYMASLTGAVLESILYKAVEYPTLHGHRRYQPFSVYQRPIPTTPISQQQQQQQQQQSSPSSSSQSSSSSSSSSSQQQQQQEPRLLLKSSSATDFVREMLHHMAQLGVELQPILAPPMYQLRLWVSAPVEKLQVGVATPAALFYSHLYQCLHSLVTGDYSHYTPTAFPTVSTMPSSTPTLSHVPTMAPTIPKRIPNDTSTTTTTSSMEPTPFNVTPVYIDDDDNWFNNSTLHNATKNAATRPSKSKGTTTFQSNGTTIPSNSTSTNTTRIPKKKTPKRTSTLISNATTNKTTSTPNVTRRRLSIHRRKQEGRRTIVETKPTANAPSTSPSMHAPSTSPQQPEKTPSSSVDTAQKAAEEAKEAAQVAHDAANQKDEHATATAAQKAATAAQKAADATYSAANQQAREGLLSGDGDIMANILASTCFSNPQYEITKLPTTLTTGATDNATLTNATTTNPPTTLAYLYIDGSFYYRLKMTSPYIDLVQVRFDMPPASALGANGNLLNGYGDGGDILDWALALVIVVAVVVGVTITLQAIGFRIYRPLLKWQRRFFHPQKYLNNMDHDDSERGDLDEIGFQFDDDDDSSADDAIPTSMGGRRTSWMMRGQHHQYHRGAPAQDISQAAARSQMPYASHDNDGNNHGHHVPDQYVDESMEHEHNVLANMKVVEMTPLNGADHLGRNTSHHNGRRRLSSSANRTTMSFEERLRETEVPTRFARDPDLVDLPHLKSKSKVAIPASLVVHGRASSAVDDDLSLDDDDEGNHHVIE